MAAAQLQSRNTPMICSDQPLPASTMSQRQARLLARQIAQAYWKSHQVIFCYGDLQACRCLPADPSVSSERRRAAVQSDIYAFGALLKTMIPSSMLAAWCMAENAKDRPESFEVVLEELQELSAHRSWLGTLLIGAAMFGLFLHAGIRTPAKIDVSHTLVRPSLVRPANPTPLAQSQTK